MAEVLLIIAIALLVGITVQLFATAMGFVVGWILFEMMKRFKR